MMRRTEIITILSIMAFAFALRVFAVNRVFLDMDAVMLPLYVLDSIPTRGWDSLLLWENNAIGNPLRLFGYPLGALEGFVLFFVILFYNLLGVPITEFNLIVPIILISVCAPLAVYILVKTLSNKKAAALSALLIAILPIQVMESRHLGAAWVPAFILQALVIKVSIAYFEERKRRHALLTSLLLALYILTENQFAPLFIVVFYVGLVYAEETTSYFSRVRETLYRVLRLELLFLPMLVLLGLFVLHAVTQYCNIDAARGVGVLGHILVKDLNPGIYLSIVGKNVLWNVGYPLSIVIVLSIILGFKNVYQLNKKSIPLVWSILYFIPFIVTSPTDMVRGYIVHGVSALVIFSSIVVVDLKVKNRLGSICKSASIVILIILTLITTISTVYPYRITAWMTLPPFQGCFMQDNGIKTIGYWIRTNSRPTEQCFVDHSPPVGFNLHLCRYYFHRVTYAYDELMHDERVSETYHCLSRIKDSIDIFIISPHNIDIFTRTVDKVHHSVTIVRKGEPTCFIFSRRKYYSTPLILNANQYNSLFDSKFANLESLIDSPHHKICVTEVQPLP